MRVCACVLKRKQGEMSKNLRKKSRDTKETLNQVIFPTL